MHFLTSHAIAPALLLAVCFPTSSVAQEDNLLERLHDQSAESEDPLVDDEGRIIFTADDGMFAPFEGVRQLEPGDVIYTFNNSDEARRVVARITNSVGLNPNF